MNTFYFILAVACLINSQVGVIGQLFDPIYGGSPVPVDDDGETSVLLALILLAAKSRNSCNCCESVQPKYIPVPFPVPFPISPAVGNASEEDDTASDKNNSDMAFTDIIIAVAYFLQVSIAQINNGQPYNQNFNPNNVGESEKGLQNIADNSNFRRNYINFAENHLSQSKLSQNRLSDFFNQKTSPLQNYQNTIFTNNPNQFSNTRQQNVETQDVPSALWSKRQDPNLGNNVNLTPSNELPLTSNILPAPNIANYLVPTAPSTQAIIPPSLTISTSLPSFVPKALPTTNYIKLQPRNQLTHDKNSNKVFAALAEPPKITTNAANYYYVPQNPPSASSQKSLSMKTLLPLILNLLNDKNDECSCCSHCQRRNSRNNLGEIPLIDSGYSKQRTYGSPPDESYEDSESEEEINDVEKKNDKSYKNRYRKRKHRRNNLSDEDNLKSQSDED